jgi:hypothetical protein
MDKQENARKKIVKYIFVIYWLLIFEGALRKWFFPQFHEIIFFMRDPIVLFVYIIALRNGIVKRDELLTTGIVISLVFILLIFLQVLITKINVLTLIYGWRMYFYYLPLAFVIKDAFHHEDIHKLIKHTLYISIPLSVLAYFQFNSPVTSFINQGFSTFEVFTVTPGIVRTYGTFSFTSGQTMFAASLMSMLAFAWLYRKRYLLLSMSWLMVTTGTSLTILLLTGSRGAFFMTGLIIIATFIGLLFTNETKLKANGIMLLVFLVLVGTLMFMGPFKKSFDAMGNRFKGAEAVEGNPIFRAIAPLTLFTNQMTTVPIMGHGLGITGGGGAKLAAVKATWLYAEDEWSRVIVESGPGFGLTFILFRVYFTVILARRCIKAATQDNNILPMILFGFIGYYLFQGQITSVGVFQGYNWIFVGLTLAAIQKQHSATVQPISKPVFLNIIGA